MSKEKVLFAEGPIGIAGAGRIGQALGRLLRERGEPVVAVASRHPQHAEAAATFVGGGAKAVPYSRLRECAARVLIAVPDDAVAQVAGVLAEAGMSQGAALHTCGTRGPEALARLAARGVSCATFHPLQTVASPEQGVASLPGVAFAITGEGPARAWAERIAALLDGQVLWIPSDRRPLYHAAAVMASNYVVGLLDAAVMLMAAAGVEEDKALRALAPLAQASMANALTLGPRNALTGPVERGDLETVSTHLKALGEVSVPVRELYRAAGLQVLRLARQRGLSEANARKLEELFQESEKSNV
jgi:predicted short-subunit dehydrogenase-like oxidoreductase (DUF2520 family)